MALASVIVLAIESVFPDSNQESKQWIFDGGMPPGEKKPLFAESKVAILWSRIRTMNGSFGDKANHSVPLVEEAEEFADEIVSVDLNTVKKEISIHDIESRPRKTCIQL